MYYMHKTIDLLAILDIHKNLDPNCGMWDMICSKYIYLKYEKSYTKKLVGVRLT